MSVLVDEDVFGLQIPKEDILLVDVVDSKKELGADELCELLIEKLVGI